MTRVANIVLMGTVAQTLHDLLHFQLVDYPIEYTRQVMDTIDVGSFSIESQLEPALEEIYQNITTADTEAKCPTGTCPIWLRSHGELEPTLDIIGNVPNYTSILLMNGENDSQTPVQQAFLLEQRLNEVNHPDHTLITYPDLGHVFSPSSQWTTEFGPIEQYVLSDLHRWLIDRTFGLR